MRAVHSSLSGAAHLRRSAMGGNGRLLMIIASWTLSLVASLVCWAGLIRLVTLLVAGR